ncbi:MAG: carbohydrate binding family 9 domain-containing protein [candidate division Zixibacteria bacterium]|nr:carbohydrate binding family 9 domain-containing protein [candidate division Zixibacteria bacterium]
MKSKIAIVFYFAIIMLLASNLSFAEDSLSVEKIVRELRATRINPNPPVINGDLNDEVWLGDNLDLAKDFIQREPDEGKAATESTVVAVAYDDDALYFAFWCYDSEPDKIARQLVRRDRWGDSDIITVRLDPYHDHQTGYRFDVSAAGVQRDCRLYNDTWSDYSWDSVWESDVKAQPWGWSAEIRIPFHCLRFTEKDEHTWGMNVTRYISRRNESPWWAFSPSAEGGFVSRFGHLTGLKGIKPSRHIEILPYAVSGIELEPTDQGNPDGRDYMKNVGFDFKYGLSSNLILDAAINPDFGQVELDRPVLNLSTYETYYEEKRPFFVEGANLFDTRFGLFYSRRIGRPPRGDIDDVDNDTYDPKFDYYTHYPKSTTILGAAKITGKLESGTSIAFLNAVTQEEIAKYDTVLSKPYEDIYTSTAHSKRLLAAAEESSRNNLEGIVEPIANYSAFRLQQDILSKSSIGGMITLASQDKRNPVTTGGVDWRLFTKNGKWEVSGQTVFSRVDNENTGYGFDGKIEKAAGESFRGAIGVNIKDTHLDLNRLGYLSRNDEKGGWMWLQYRTNDDWWIVRNSWNNFNTYAEWNSDDYNLSKGWNVNSCFDFINNWTLCGGYDMQFGEYNDLETRGNGVWKRPSSWGWWMSLNTDERKKVSFNWNPGSGHARYGSWRANWISVGYRPASNMEFEIGTNYVRGFNQIIWVENDDDNSIFADMNQDEIVLSLTASIMFTRDLSCQLSGQGYISGIDYQDYRRYLSGENYEPYELDEEDFHYSALNSTLIIRWEYIPGSTMYFVWTRSMSDWNNSLNDIYLRRDMEKLFSGDADNVFLIKTSYWWNL